MGRRDGERGSESVELAILLPVAILVLALVVVGGRVVLAGNRVSGVAGTAAREASLARTPAAIQALDDRDLHCRSIAVDVDTSRFSAVPGAGAAVSVQVTCTVDLSDIGFAGLPGSRTLDDAASSPVDPTRSTS